MARAARENQIAWTPEKVQEWCRAEGYFNNERRRIVTQIGRREVVRLCPEADDYNALCRRLERDVPEWSTTFEWKSYATDAEVIQHVGRCVAALMRQSFAPLTESDEVPS